MESEVSMLLQYIDNAVEIRHLKVCSNVTEMREIVCGHDNVMNARTIRIRKEINDLKHSNICLWTVIFFMIIERI